MAERDNDPNAPNDPNEIDLIAHEYLAQRGEAEKSFVQEARSGWQLSTLEAALGSFHARWIGAREITRG